MVFFSQLNKIIGPSSKCLDFSNNIVLSISFVVHESGCTEKGNEIHHQFYPHYNEYKIFHFLEFDYIFQKQLAICD